MPRMLQQVQAYNLPLAPSWLLLHASCASAVQDLVVEMLGTGLGCPGGLVLAVGTYERAVELLLLDRHHSTTNGICWHFQRLCQFQHTALCPVLHSSGMPPNLTDVPESVLLLKEGSTGHSEMQVWKPSCALNIQINMNAL